MTDEELIQKAQGYFKDLKILNVVRKKNKNYFEIICPYCGEKRDELSTLYSIKKKAVSCSKCRKILIKQTKNSKIKYEDSFEQNDNFDRSRFWNYSLNTQKPSEISRYTKKKFWFRCEKEHDFKASIESINKKGTWCPICATFLKESKMAVVLKQVIKHEFPDTIWEYDIGFRGEKGGISRYDIYIPELNLLIECQSEYHDTKTEFDLKKQLYAQLKGFDFISIDNRQGTPLDIIKIFFPYIQKIPNYVGMLENTKINWDLKKAQELISNSDKTISEVAKELKINIGSLYNKIYKNELKVPKNKHIEKEIVQLDFEGNLLKQYKSARECCRMGNFNPSDISSCCKGRQLTHKGFIFMYLKDYLNKEKDNFGRIFVSEQIKQAPCKNKKKKVYQYSLSGEFIKQYESLTDVQKETGFDLRNISACCKGKTKTSNGFIWRFDKIN